MGVMSITIRSVTDDDAPQLAVLLGQLGYPATPDEVRARLAYWAADSGGALLAAGPDTVAGGALAGVAALHAVPFLEHTGYRGRLVALVVDTAYRGSGVGRALLAAAERRARALGCRDIEITSARDRLVAQGFYARMGYEDVCGRAARFVKRLDAV